MRTVGAPDRGVGFFGKLPSRGDFLRGNLPRASIAAVDGWLQTVIPAAIALLGDATWRTLWDQGPAWRFRLPPGACGPGRLTGVWLPSRDAAGRAFPFVVATGEGDVDAIVLDRLEHLCIDAVRNTLAPDRVASALACVRSPRVSGPPAPHDPVGRWWRQRGAVADPVLVLSGLPDADDLVRMLTGS